MDGSNYIAVAAGKLELAGFRVGQGSYAGMTFISVYDHHGNAVAIYEDGIVVVELRHLLWGLLLTATNRATDGLVISGMRQHAREHGCDDYARLADLVETLDQHWDTMVEEQQGAVGGSLTPAELVERMLSMVDGLTVSEAYDA